MRFVFVLGLVIGIVNAQDSGTKSQHAVKTVHDGLLDEIVVYVASVPSTPETAIVMRHFSGLDADLGTGSEGGKEERPIEAKTIKSEGPKVLAEQFVTTLKERGPYTTVSSTDVDTAAPAGSIVVEGKFTTIDPGSRAKRYFVGFGAGKSTVSVSGTVKDSTGAVLATFSQTRHGVMGMGGGDSLGKLLADSRNIGEDIAEFLSAWAKGKALK